MIEINLTLYQEKDPSVHEGEQMTIYTHTILKSLLESSVQKSLHMAFTQENQQVIAEEIGYRRALQDFASYFTFPQENK